MLKHGQSLVWRRTVARRGGQKKILTFLARRTVWSKITVRRASFNALCSSQHCGDIRNIFCGQPTAWAEPAIVIAALLDIDKVLIPGEEGALTYSLGGAGAAHLLSQSAH